MKSNKRLVYTVVAGVLFMFAFSFMLVPIFTFVCKQAGINGKGVTTATKADKNMQVDRSRSIRIDFASTLNGKFAFDFKPEQQSVTVHPGERKIIYYYAKNNTGRNIIVQAVPSITPADGARFFKKIECFCFTQQRFLKNEKAHMFVNFYIDPSVPKEVKELTLSYTMFDASAFAGKNVVRAKGRV